LYYFQRAAFLTRLQVIPYIFFENLNELDRGAVNQVKTWIHRLSRQNQNHGKTDRMQFIKQIGAFILRYVFLPNVPFLVLGNFINFDRPLISLDYIVLGVLAPLFSKGINLALFFIWLIADLFVSATSIFRLPISDFIRATADISQLSILVRAPLLLPILLLILALVRFAALFKAPSSHRIAGHGVIILLAFLILYSATASSSLKGHVGWHCSRFSDSTIWRFAYAAVLDFKTPKLEEERFLENKIGDREN
jgi:hypothetical protein